jgi:hypothetical protein
MEKAKAELDEEVEMLTQVHQSLDTLQVKARPILAKLKELDVLLGKIAEL